jgi:hypothetical protein
VFPSLSKIAALVKLQPSSERASFAEPPIASSAERLRSPALNDATAAISALV